MPLVGRHSFLRFTLAVQWFITIECQCPWSGAIHFYGIVWEAANSAGSRGVFCTCFSLVDIIFSD